MMPTVTPAKSTPWWGHRPVWYTGPPKSSAPSIRGVFGTDRQPVAMMQKRATYSSPASVMRCHRLLASS